MSPIDYNSLTDRELLIVLATKMENMENCVLGHIPQDCIANQGRITGLELAVGELKEDLKEAKDSTTWAFRAAAGAVLAAMVSLGQWILTTVMGKSQ